MVCLYAILHVITNVINTTIKITERLAREKVAKNATNTQCLHFLRCLPTVES